MAQAKRKKRFFDVEIPLIGKETQLQAYELKELDGRYIEYDLTRLLKGKGMLIQFLVKVEGDKIITIPRGAKLVPYFIARMIRKGTNYVEDSFSVKCKDAQIKIKPFLITRRKVSRAVRNALRIKAREDLIDYAKGKTSEEIFEDLVRNQIQRPLSLRLKEVYPLSLCEIRYIKVENRTNEPKSEVKEKENIKPEVKEVVEVTETKEKKEVKKKAGKKKEE